MAGCRHEGGALNACPSCGAQLRAGDRFCASCGAAQALTCPQCGAENSPGNRFCPACGSGLGQAEPRPPAVAQPVTERRLVSVLFADLVGFTTLSEHRDPEEVRDLLSRYFDRCRSLIERYGGIVEKFIGDAVMAVWGTPVAREDDAERAVRAALDLVDAVTALGHEVGMPDLRVRAGVLTGSAAVEVGAEGEGMVLGDTVNTASRLQSIAAPGTVLVDTVTRRATEAAITYEDAGEHHVKGREQPVHAWAALRVVARVGGARRHAEPEAPLIGRDLIRQALIAEFESTVGGRGAGLVTLTGEAGDRQEPDGLGAREARRRRPQARSCGTTGARCPTATASRSGRSPRWSGCEPDRRGGGHRERRRQAARNRRALCLRRARAPARRAAAGRPDRAAPPAHRRPGRPVLRLAAVHRADV